MEEVVVTAPGNLPPFAEVTPPVENMGDVKDEVKAEGEEEDAHIDLYRPLPMDPGLPVEEHILTFRSIVVGCILGGVTNASNLYLGESPRRRTRAITAMG
jgi:hypothetical protein